MERVNILIVNDPSRKEESDIDNAFSAIGKYVDDAQPTLRTISGFNYIAWELYERIESVLGKRPGMTIFVANYKSNEEIIKHSDVLILLPALDRSGFCEDIEKKWLKIKSDVNIEVM